MQLVKIKDLPHFLLSSQLCKNSFECADEETTISVPKKNCMSSSIITTPKLQIKNHEEFINLLHVIRYWMVDDIPNEIYKYVEDNYRSFFMTEHNKLDDLKKKFNDPLLIGEFEILTSEPRSMIESVTIEIGGVLRSKHNYEYDQIIKFMNNAIEKKYINLVKYLCSKCDMYELVAYMEERIYNSTWNRPFDNFIVSAIKNDYLDILKHINKCFRINSDVSIHLYLSKYIAQEWNLSPDMIEYLDQIKNDYIKDVVK